MLHLTRNGATRVWDRVVFAAAPLLFASGVAMAMGCCAAMTGLGDAPICGDATMSAPGLRQPAEICLHAAAAAGVSALVMVAAMALRPSKPAAHAAIPA